MDWLSRAWRRYWFGTEGRISVEVARIAIALTALLTWLRSARPDYAALLRSYPAGSYEPLGMLRLFGSDPPPPFFLELCKVIALVAIVAMLVGLASRISNPFSAITMLIIGGLRESFDGGWHHSLTPVLTVELVFAFVPCGRALSVDALLRKLRNRRSPYILDQDPRPRALDIERHGGRLYYRPRDTGRHLFMAAVGDDRFIIAQAKHRIRPDLRAGQAHRN